MGGGGGGGGGWRGARLRGRGGGVGVEEGRGLISPLYSLPNRYFIRF